MVQSPRHKIVSFINIHALLSTCQPLWPKSNLRLRAQHTLPENLLFRALNPRIQAKGRKAKRLKLATLPRAPRSCNYARQRLSTQIVRNADMLKRCTFTLRSRIIDAKGCAEKNAIDFALHSMFFTHSMHFILMEVLCVLCT